MITQMPFIYEGEILAVLPHNEKDVQATRYTCKITMQNGRQIIVNNARATNAFGGVDNYFYNRARASKDDTESFESSLKLSTQQRSDACVGDRVFVTFIAGNISNPVIIGFDTHPNQAKEVGSPDSEKPHMVFQYNGVRAEITEDGDLKVIHKGLPTVKFAPPSASPLAALSSLSSLDSPIGGNDSPAITPAEDTEITLFEMSKDGVFRLRDQEGQVFELDRSKPHILISNNNKKSTDKDTSLTPFLNSSEYLQMEKGPGKLKAHATKLLDLESLGDRNDTVGKNQTIKITGELSVSVGTNVSETINGGKDVTIQRNEKKNVRGNIETTAIGSVKIEGKKEASIKDGIGAGMVAKGGKIAFGTPAFELLEGISKFLEKIIAAAPTFVSTAVGPGVLDPNVLTEATALKAQIDASKGSL